MPIKSKKQFRLMQAAAHGGSNIGPSEEVAKEMIAKTSKKRRKELAKK